jgi:hypothetical protein
MALTWRWNNRRSSIINLKAAKQIGLTIPPNVFAISGELAGKIQISTRILSSVEKGADDTQ